MNVNVSNSDFFWRGKKRITFELRATKLALMRKFMLVYSGRLGTSYKLISDFDYLECESNESFLNFVAFISHLTGVVNYAFFFSLFYNLYFLFPIK